MPNRPTVRDGERRQTDELAPENTNSEQRDGDSQSHTVAEDARDRTTSAFSLGDSEKLESSFNAPNVEDLVDHINQMLTSGAIDMSAYAGEPNHDDEDETYGKRPEPEE